ncbi:CPBP family intramembrane glutamic endopeptidase [Alloiococcus otitis]|uniref:CPBP family intramembrane glutamic endopeptidase n=1 Tax=Alloiococcus otitis TaxID=1652 RepID=UPI002355C312|nr:CPBP family intramembrane glutamic endopeptidase [Alloiococcus otitis]
MKMKFGESVLFSIALILIAGLLMNISNILHLMFFDTNSLAINNILFIIFGTISFVLIPRKFVNWLNIFPPKTKLNVNYLRLFVVVAIMLVLSSNMAEYNKLIIHRAIIVSLLEEYLFRFIIYNIFLHNSNQGISYILTSLLFSMILHLNGSVIGNLLIKFPSALILQWIYIHIGYECSVTLHSLNNIIVSLI